MATFENIFAVEVEALEEALSGVQSEQKHIRRCMELAAEVEWNRSNAGNELGKLLGVEGVVLFDRATQRIASMLENEANRPLDDCGHFLRCLMLVHDIGKFDRETQTFNGSGHEERSGNYVLEKKSVLMDKLYWSEPDAALLVHLTRFHSHLGIARLGEVSNVFLEPVLQVLLELDTSRKRLFLDYLIVMTCCDAGASGNFETGVFYLDESRIAFYTQVAEELFEISQGFGAGDNAEAAQSLLADASSNVRTIDRIRRMVTADNKLDAEPELVDQALQRVVSNGLFHLPKFAVTQFDHGAYVFAPLLERLSKGSKSVSLETLEKFLIFLGVLNSPNGDRKVLQFRRSFSMKADLHTANADRFNELFRVVERGDSIGIAEVVARAPR